MNIGNITSDNFNLDSNGKDIQIEVYEQLIEQLQQENKQLKDNWNKLKNCMIDIFNRTQEIYYLDLLETMQELEQGSDNNDSN